MTIAKGVASSPPVTAAILESSPAYAAMLTAVVRNAGWEPRALVRKSLVAVHGTPDDVRRAQEIMQQTGGTNVMQHNRADSN